VSINANLDKVETSFYGWREYMVVKNVHPAITHGCAEKTEILQI
jgi:hypothetical protein